MNNKNRKAEKGQSLVEFVLLIPIFFILLSGLNLYLNQGIKTITEYSAHESLLISDSHFENAERTLAKWNGAELETTPYHVEILKHSFNTSLYFNQSTDMKDNVFLDKKNISQNKQNACENNFPFYNLESSENGKFKFSSCTNGEGFERTTFSYQNIIENFQPTTKVLEGRSIYYPKEHFIWSQRHLGPSNAVRDFALTFSGNNFRKQYASIIPTDKSEFNINCFMNPNKHECSLPSLTGKWRRTAEAGAASQLLGCAAEIVIDCEIKKGGAAAGGVGAIVCTSYALEEIARAAMSGEKLNSCPIFNSITEKMYAGVEVLSKTYEKMTYAKETEHRTLSVFAITH